MEFIDEEGRLFGRVNVVDALVVAFAFAVIVAGGALVLGGESAEESGDETATSDVETMYVTAELDGTAAAELDPDDARFEGHNATITDVHRTAGPRTFVRLELEGERTDDGFRFAGDPIRRGDGVTMLDDETRASGSITERDTEPTFDTETRRVTVEETVRSPVANAVVEGDEQRVGGESIATVAAVDRTTVNETHTTVRVDLDLDVRLVDGVAHYGDAPVRLGRTIPVETDSYEFDATVTAVE